MNINKTRILIYKKDNEYYTSLFQSVNTSKSPIRIEIKVKFSKEDNLYLDKLFRSNKLKYTSININGSFSFETIENQFSNLVIYAKLSDRG